MGNCQVTEASAVLLQHPGGRVERMYWPTSAGEVMKSNPGYYVALITIHIPLDEKGGRRVTRVRLLRAKDTLILGQVYRLVTSQEVMKGLRARKHEKPPRVAEEAKRHENHQKHQKGEESSDLKNEKTTTQVAGQERDRQRTAVQSAIRVRQWRPSLQSISEAAS